jgi:transcriptional antiterminator RfaH
MSKFTKGWYLMYTKPNQERKVVSQLVERNLTVFLPLRKMHVVSNGSISGIACRERPMFPSYVFIKLSQVSDFYHSMEVDGFLKYIRFGNDFPRIDEEVISNLKLILSEGKQIQIARNILPPGCVATIKRGPLAGLTCKVIKHCKSSKIFVSLTLLNNTVSAILPFSTVS